MDFGMSYDEVKLAMRIIGLRGTSMKATKNYWERRMAKDRPLILSLQDKGHVETQGDGWKMTSQGIQQLKQQIGEFSFR
jgi:coproporphyrinogen III oxidase-like Fe-S oxidoreductase